MSQRPQREPTPPENAAQGGDPWHAVGYLSAGVLLYGVLGWLADQWLGTSFLVAVGILAGSGLGLYLTWNRFNRPTAGDGDST